MNTIHVIFFEYVPGQCGWVAWLIAKWARCRYYHVAISDGEAVLNQSIAGPGWHPHTQLAQLSQPYAIVTLTGKPDIDTPPGNIRLWRVLVRGLTFGLLPANDCVSVVADRLRDAGIPIPALWTPDQLHAHLTIYAAVADHIAGYDASHDSVPRFGDAGTQTAYRRATR